MRDALIQLSIVSNIQLQREDSQDNNSDIRSSVLTLRTWIPVARINLPVSFSVLLMHQHVTSISMQEPWIWQM